MTSIPLHCYAGGAVVLGASIVATQLHQKSDIPKHCIASSLLGSAAVTGAIAHHGSFTKFPPVICVVSGLSGVGALGVALSAHSSFAKIPMHCKLYTGVGLTLLLTGVAFFAKR
mmetsp:Transcript_62637/g.104241  ORF Transcript_62637/g.104241 Transcript_62637/m.104241 type:complete len:114 (+) Transcript_62637:53-394(+)